MLITPTIKVSLKHLIVNVINERVLVIFVNLEECRELVQKVLENKLAKKLILDLVWNLIKHADFFLRVQGLEPIFTPSKSKVVLNFYF